MEVIEHHIQREILNRLMHAKGLRFSELKPEGMESNVFMYHLKQLIKVGYVEKNGQSYGLAAAGLSYVDGLSTTNHKPRKQPKLIAVLAIQNESGQWLLAERKIQPYIGTRMFPSGKQHHGETSTEHAVRELREKTGLTNVVLSFRGIADIQIKHEDGTVLTHAVAMVYSGKVEDISIAESDRFQYVWHDFAHDAVPLMAGTRELYDYLAENKPFNTELMCTA